MFIIQPVDLPVGNDITTAAVDIEALLAIMEEIEQNGVKEIMGKSPRSIEFQYNFSCGNVYIPQTIANKEQLAAIAKKILDMGILKLAANLTQMQNAQQNTAKQYINISSQHCAAIAQIPRRRKIECVYEGENKTEFLAENGEWVSGYNYFKEKNAESTSQRPTATWKLKLYQRVADNMQNMNEVVLRKLSIFYDIGFIKRAGRKTRIIETSTGKYHVFVISELRPTDLTLIDNVVKFPLFVSDRYYQICYELTNCWQDGYTISGHSWAKKTVNHIFLEFPIGRIEARCTDLKNGKPLWKCAFCEDIIYAECFATPIDAEYQLQCFMCMFAKNAKKSNEQVWFAAVCPTTIHDVIDLQTNKTMPNGSIITFNDEKRALLHELADATLLNVNEKTRTKVFQSGNKTVFAVADNFVQELFNVDFLVLKNQLKIIVDRRSVVTFAHAQVNLATDCSLEKNKLWNFINMIDENGDSIAVSDRPIGPALKAIKSKPVNFIAPQ